MPRYYFDTFDGSQVLADEFGDEFHSEIEAARQAASLLPDFIRDGLSKQDSMRTAVSVRNDCDEVIYRSMSVTLSQWPSRENYSYRVEINGEDCIMSQSRRFRAEMQDLRDRMRASVTGLFHLVESARANMEISRRLLRGDKL